MSNRTAYEEYLLTPEWAERRVAVLARDDHRCTRCPATSHLEVHHRTYARLGTENLDDLVTLCVRCHGLEHGYHQNPPVDNQRRILAALAYKLGRPFPRVRTAADAGRAIRALQRELNAKTGATRRALDGQT